MPLTLCCSWGCREILDHTVRNGESVGQQILPAGREIVLKNIAGNALEIQAEIDPREVKEVCLSIFRSPGKAEYTESRAERRIREK